MAPQTKYIVFEVESVEFEYLEEIICKRPDTGPRPQKLFGHGDDDRLLKNLRNLKRLHFYSRKHAWTAMKGSTSGPRPALFRQPALEPPYRQSDERPLFFLMRSLTDNVPEDTSTGPFLNFAYDALYSSAYPFPKGSRELEKALDYVQSVKQRVSPELRRCVFQPLRIATAMTDLLHRAADEGYREQLIL